MTCEALALVAGAIILEPLAGFAASDMIVLAPHETADAELCYYNHENGASKIGTYRLELDGLPVLVYVDFTKGSEEKIIVEVPFTHWIYPSDKAESELLDGESVQMLIMSGVS